MKAGLQCAVARQIRTRNLVYPYKKIAAHGPPRLTWRGVKRRPTSSRLLHQSSEEYAPRWSMLEKRDNQVPVPVESRRAPDDRHHTVGQREIEQRIDFGVGHPLSHH